MIKWDNLETGHYYEVIFSKGTPAENIYIVKALSPDRVKVRWKNGRLFDTTGNIKGASIRKITKYHYSTGVEKEFENNDEALQLLSKGDFL